MNWKKGLLVFVLLLGMAALLSGTAFTDEPVAADYVVKFTDGHGRSVSVVGNGQVAVSEILAELGYETDADTLIGFDPDSVDTDVIRLYENDEGVLMLTNEYPFVKASKNLILYIDGVAVELEVTDDTVFQDGALFGVLYGNTSNDESNPMAYVLTSDIKLSKTILIGNGYISIDLNGHVLDARFVDPDAFRDSLGAAYVGNAIFVDMQGCLTIKDSYSGDGQHEGEYAGLPAGGVIFGGTGDNFFQELAGGVIHNQGHLTMEGGTVYGGTIGYGGYGGGIANGGTITLNGTVIDSCKVEFDSGYGGGAFCNKKCASDPGPGKATLNGVTFRNCSASMGSGISMIDGSVTINGDTIIDGCLDPIHDESSCIWLSSMQDNNANILTLNGTIAVTTQRFPTSTHPDKIAKTGDPTLDFGSYISKIVSGDERFITQKVTNGSTDIISLVLAKTAAESDGIGFATLQGAVNQALGNNVKITLVDDIKENVIIRSSKSIILDMNGHVIEAVSQDSVITVQSGAKLSIIDNSPERTHSGAYAALPAGAVITGGSAVNGGGICSYGTLEVKGITVCGCAAFSDSTSTTSTGGGIFANGATTVLDGVKIQNCTALSTEGYGGGIGVNDTAATLTIKGGTVIEGCTATFGGGISSKGTLTIENTAINSCSATSIAGGMLVMNGVGNLNGGTVIENCSSEEIGGVYLMNGSMTLNDATVKNCTSGVYGAFLFQSNGTLKVGGSTSITGNTITSLGTAANLFLFSSNVLTVLEGFTGDIGITTFFKPNPVESVGFADSNAIDYSAYFHSDEGYRVFYDRDDNMLYLGMNRVTVSWTGEDTLIYNGSAQLPQWTVSGIDASLVTVSGARTEVGSGTATAAIASGHAAYYIESGDECNFSISPKELTVSNTAVSNKVYDATTAAVISGMTLSGVVTGDNVILTASGAFSDAKAGTDKEVPVTYVISGDDAANYTLQSSGETLKASISAKELTVGGTKASDKVYDGTTGAVITDMTLSGLLAGDSVILTAEGAFTDAKVGTAKDVLVTYAISGDDAANYTLQSSGETLKASISAKELTISGAKASDKVYDGTTDAVITDLTLSGVVTGDTVILTAEGAFTDAKAGTAKDVPVTYAISGADAANYTLQSSGETLKASISAKELTISGAKASDKVYDGTTDAVISDMTLSGVVTGDTVTLTAEGAFTDAKAGTAKDVPVTYAISGADAANYTLQISGETLTATISAKELAISGTKASDKIYDGTANAEVTDMTLSGVLTGDTVTLTAVGAFSDAKVGEGKTVTVTYTLSGADAANYTLQTSAETLNASISAKTLTISGTKASDKIYDGTANAEMTDMTLSGVVPGDSVILTAVGAFSDAKVGDSKNVLVTYAISGDDIANYTLQITSETLTASISAKTLTISGTKASDKVYDGKIDVELTGMTLNGVVVGDNVILTAEGTFKNDRVGTNKVVAVTYAISGDDVANYMLQITSETVTASISAKELTVSGAKASDKVYDGTTDAEITGMTLEGVVDGDQVILTAEGAFKDAKAGSSKDVAVTYTISGASDFNYKLKSENDTLTASISAKEVSVTGAKASDKVYDGNTDAEITGMTLSGVVDGDQVILTAEGSFKDAKVEATKDVPVVYAISGADAANYSLQTSGETLTASIYAKELTVSGTKASDKVYDGKTDVDISGMTLSGVLDGDSVILTAEGAFKDAKAGTDKDVPVSYTLSGTEAENYKLKTVDEILTASIQPAELTVSGAEAADKVYDGKTDAAITGMTLSGVVDGDSVILTAEGAFTDAKAGTAKDVNVTYAISGDAAANYTLVTVGETLTASISAKEISVSGTKVSDKVYNGKTDAELTGMILNDVVDGDQVVLTVEGAFKDAKVGTDKEVPVTYAISGEDAENYKLKTEQETLTAAITPAELTVSGTEVSDKVYDGKTDAEISGMTLSGVVDGDSVVLTVEGAFKDAKAGEKKEVPVSYTISGSDASNYTLKSSGETLTASIACAELTVTGTKASDKIYDGMTAAVITDMTLHGVIDGDNVVLTVEGTFKDAKVGENKEVLVIYAISGDEASNYRLQASEEALTASVSPKVLTVSGAKASDKVYDGTIGAEITGMTLVGVVDGDRVTVSVQGSFKDAKAGEKKEIGATYVISGEDASNYELTTTKEILTASIQPAGLTVTGGKASDKVYDGTTEAAVSGMTLSGILGDDHVTLTAKGTFLDAKVGTAKDVTVTYAISGADAENYRLTTGQESLKASISAREISVTVTKVADKMYNGKTDAELTGMKLIGAVKGDRVILTAEGTFQDAGAGDAKDVVVHYTITGADAGNYRLKAEKDTLKATIMPAELTVRGTKVHDKVYNGKTDAELSGMTLSGVIQGDRVTLSAQGVFKDAKAGAAKEVSVDYTLSGADAGNYTLANGKERLTASISAKEISVSGTKVSDKVYDGKTNAEITGMTLSGILNGDKVTLNAQGSFNNADVGTAKNVAVSYALTGADAGNYKLTTESETLNASICVKELTVSGTKVSDKSYDGKTDVEISGMTLSGVIDGDNVLLNAMGAFKDADAGEKKDVNVVYAISGEAASNYILKVSGETLVATIKPAEYRMKDESGKLLEKIEETYIRRSGKTAIFRCEGAFKDFIGLTVDGERVGTEHFIVSEGSTVVEFKEAYLDTLKEGEHDIQFLFKNGASASCTLHVKAESGSTFPTTAVVIGASGLIVLLAVAGVVIFKKKKKAA